MPLIRLEGVFTHKKRQSPRTPLIPPYTNRPKFPLPILPIATMLVVLLTNRKDYEHVKQIGVRVTV